MLIGTVEGGYVIHLKGIVLIEVPGPRLLLIMKADVLSAPPALKSDQTATFLAVLDIDFGRGTITIGLVAEYAIESLLKIRVPVTAFFDANEPEEWLVELGNYTDRVTVEVLDVISGSGYLMVHGNGVSIPGLPPIAHGLAVATGFHIQAVLMGSKSIGLYLEVAAGFDAILGLDPFFLGGKIYVSGELRLFIVSVGASAELTVLVGKRIENGVEVETPYVHGKVCGHVDLFFFEIEGCVELTIGEEPDKTPVPRDLVAGVTLISRSPAKVEGSAVDRPVDGKLGDARDTTGTDPAPSVPLDAIPVVLFRTAPTGDGPIVMGAAAFGQSGVGANPWTRIGDRWWKYELLDVSLTGPLQPAAGKTPATWWSSAPPADPADGPALALLDWLPTPHPAAVPYGEALTTQVDHRWGTVCDPPAPPAPTLWTFDHEAVGPRPPGWNLHGIAWPDPPGTVRTAPVNARLDVTEPWRCGNVAIDRIQGTDPAVVVGDLVPCKTSGVSPTAPLKNWLAGQPAAWSSSALPQAGEVFADMAEILANGAGLGDAAAVYAEQAWDPAFAASAIGHGTKLDCAGRVLRSPVGDQPDPAPRGTDDDRQRVKLVWSELGYEPRRARRRRPPPGAGPAGRVHGPAAGARARLRRDARRAVPRRVRRHRPRGASLVGRHRERLQPDSGRVVRRRAAVGRPRASRGPHRRAHRRDVAGAADARPRHRPRAARADRRSRDRLGSQHPPRDRSRPVLRDRDERPRAQRAAARELRRHGRDEGPRGPVERAHAGRRRPRAARSRRDVHRGGDVAGGGAGAGRAARRHGGRDVDHALDDAVVRVHGRSGHGGAAGSGAVDPHHLAGHGERRRVLP